MSNCRCASSGLSWYSFITAIWRTIQTVAIVGWIALLTCSIQYWAIFPGVVALIFYIEMQKEPDGQRPSIWPAVVWGVSFAILMALLSALFFGANALDNNYANSTGKRGGETFLLDFCFPFLLEFWSSFLSGAFLTKSDCQFDRGRRPARQSSVL